MVQGRLLLECIESSNTFEFQQRASSGLVYMWKGGYIFLYGPVGERKICTTLNNILRHLDGFG